MLKLTKDREWIAKPHATQKKAASAKVSISQKNYGKSTVEKCGGRSRARDLCLENLKEGSILETPSVRHIYNTLREK